MSTTASINVGGAERSLADATPGWIQDQFGSRGKTGAVCVRVSLHAPGVNLNFATEACGAGVGSSRPFTEAEKRIIDLWRKHKLDTDEFSVAS